MIGRNFNINSYNNFTRNEISVMSENMPAKTAEDAPLDITELIHLQINY